MLFVGGTNRICDVRMSPLLQTLINAPPHKMKGR